MAYFSNGTESESFVNECAECILGNEECPIRLVHLNYNYEACNNKVATAILNNLVRQENFEYVGCQMKPLLDKLVGRTAGLKVHVKQIPNRDKVVHRIGLCSTGKVVHKREKG
ncbi:MAG: hypothetical protein AMJ43_11000 [Coxiella sp. DG_40]|nr:MAG: hypothetical protein AMJ43_11000 [Coxiella sp. DG_40]